MKQKFKDYLAAVDSQVGRDEIHSPSGKVLTSTEFEAAFNEAARRLGQNYAIDNGKVVRRIHYVAPRRDIPPEDALARRIALIAGQHHIRDFEVYHDRGYLTLEVGPRGRPEKIYHLRLKDEEATAAERYTNRGWPVVSS